MHDSRFAEPERRSAHPLSRLAHASPAAARQPGILASGTGAVAAGVCCRRSTSLIESAIRAVGLELILEHGGSRRGADLWALAVVGYQCLTGRLPFDDGTLGAACEALDRAAFALPSAFRPDLSARLDAWFERAFAPSPWERFGSAAEMREAIIDACSPFSLEIPLEDAVTVRRDVA